MSLRTRLLLASVAVTLVALLVADAATYAALESFLTDRIDQNLSQSVTGPGCGAGPAAPGGTAGAGAGPGAPAGRSVVPAGGGEPSGGPDFLECIRDGTVVVAHAAVEPDGRSFSPALPAHLPTGTAGPDGTSNVYLTVPSTAAGGPQFRVLVHTEADGDVTVVGLPLDSVAETLHRLLLIELAVTVAALAASALLGLWLVRLGLRPLSDVEATAEAIAAGDLGRRVPGDDRRTEVGRLARVLNTMLARIQQAFAERDRTEAELRRSEERMRRFIGDASHELRTPLAAVTAYTELYSRGADVRPDDLARVLQGIRGESARMKQLVEDLLLLARLDEGRPLEQRSVELVTVAADAVHAAVAVGPAWPVTLQASAPVELLGDAGRLRQVLDNLLANVRAHTPEGTATTVTVRRDGDTAVVEVADDGPGLDGEQASKVFERFYRADPSRARSSGGAGLGLSIVAAIVEAHGGTVAVDSTVGGGTTFSVSLPVGGVAAGGVAADSQDALRPP